jgi:hypothetical protein
MLKQQPMRLIIYMEHSSTRAERDRPTGTDMKIAALIVGTNTAVIGMATHFVNHPPKWPGRSHIRISELPTNK